MSKRSVKTTPKNEKKTKPTNEKKNLIDTIVDCQVSTFRYRHILQYNIDENIEKGLYNLHNISKLDPSPTQQKTLQKIKELANKAETISQNYTGEDTNATILQNAAKALRNAAINQEHLLSTKDIDNLRHLDNQRRDAEEKKREAFAQELEKKEQQLTKDLYKIYNKRSLTELEQEKKACSHKIGDSQFFIEDLYDPRTFAKLDKQMVMDEADNLQEYYLD
jgi:hypothetical protein